MTDRDVSDAALIVKTEADLNSTINYLIENSYIRTMVIEWDNSNSNDRLEMINPAPTMYSVYGTTDMIKKVHRYYLYSLKSSKHTRLLNKDDPI